MTHDFELLYRAGESRDARFDGRFFIAVTSTGVYCRPTCPAAMPKPSNVRFYRHAAVAELAGFRACRRCRPEVSPDAPEWDTRADLVGRGLRLIAEGVADAHGVSGLATRLGVSRRHLQRMFKNGVGAGPSVIARSRRARLARQLIDETDLPLTEVAFMAGFASVRTFNDTMRRIYRVTPTELRRGRPAAHSRLTLELPYRAPLAVAELLGFLRARAIPGVEEVTGETYRRSVSFGSGHAVIELRPGAGAVRLGVETDATGHLAPVVQRARRLMDLDAEPAVIDGALASDPLLGTLVTRRPGLRLPGAFDGFELAVRAVLGQQVSVQAASTLAGRVATRFGEELGALSGAVTHLFPDAGVLAEADLSEIGLPQRRQDAIRALASAVAAGRIVLDGSAGLAETSERLLALPGIGAWTASYVAMRALRDPDAFPVTDLGIRRAIAEHDDDNSSRHVRARAEKWRPWRGYAAMHLWTGLGARDGKAPSR